MITFFNEKYIVDTSIAYVIEATPQHWYHDINNLFPLDIKKSLGPQNDDNTEAGMMMTNILFTLQTFLILCCVMAFKKKKKTICNSRL